MAKRDAASRLLDTKRRAAALYVAGPERTRGDWAEVCKLLGVELDIQDEDVVRFIQEEGGQVLTVDTSVVAEVKPETGEITIKHQQEQIVLPPPSILKEKRKDDEWCRLAQELDPVVKGIADGTVKATAAQASTIKHILDRCYGRVQEKASEKKPASGIVVLPVLGAGQTTQECFTTCPACGWSTERKQNEATE